LSKKSAKVQQGEATTQQLIEIAREMFTQRGYASVSTTEIVKAAGVTRGALYHHFNGKEALFRAVLEHVQAGIGEQIMQAVVAESDDWQRLVKGCEAFLRASIEPSVLQIVMVDAPSVLGREVWRQIDEEATTRLLVEQLDDLVSKGIMRATSTRTLAHLLAGAMNEAVLFISEAADTEKALHDVMENLTVMLDAFRVH